MFEKWTCGNGCALWKVRGSLKDRHLVSVLEMSAREAHCCEKGPHLANLQHSPYKTESLLIVKQGCSISGTIIPYLYHGPSPFVLKCLCAPGGRSYRDASHRPEGTNCSDELSRECRIQYRVKEALLYITLFLMRY